MKPRFPGLKKCMAMMRKRDGQTKEDGFHWLLPHAKVYVHELIEEFDKEKDLGLRCWLLELIGSSQSPHTFSCLAGQLRCNNECLRHWAIWGLAQLDTKEARSLLWQARSFTFGSPAETEVFRSYLDAYRTKRTDKKHA
jgi:hypothetical protein